MFPEPAYRQQVTEEMYLFRAKLLSVIGQMNARGVLNPTSDMMETVMNTQRAILDGWLRGDTICVTVSMFDTGRFRATPDEHAPTEIDYIDTDLQNPPPDYPF